MTKFLKFLSLILLGLVMLFQTNLAQIESAHDSIIPKTILLFSELHTLSIHVKDTITHDSVFHFLVDKLKLPVYYYPLKYGKSKYAGVYAGNLVLEPCGPYSNYSYATDFRAIFFGLTFVPSELGFKSLSLAAKGLADRKIDHKVLGDGGIRFKDSTLGGDNITIGFMNRHDKNDKRKIDSLGYAMTADTGNELGIEYVKEIQIGYKDSSNFQKWKELIYPLELRDNKVFMESNILEFNFIKSNIKEVHSITFKVKSLEKAKRYLLKNNLFGSFVDNKIGLNRKQAFGLPIYLTE